MQLLPILAFYLKHGKQIETLVDSGQSGSGHLLDDLVQAAVPLLKKYYPALNQNAFLDDALALAQEVTAPVADAPAARNEGIAGQS